MLVPILVLASFACGEDEASLPDRAALADAVKAYVAAGNIESRSFDLTEPADCNLVTNREASRGKICIDFDDSRLDRTTAVLEIGVYGTEAVWTLELALKKGKWSASDSKYVGN
jgi:hypothetical protein